jgi:DNA polymerase (family 10)
MADKKKIIKLLNEIADMMEFKGENQFKVGAFRNGANSLRSIESLDNIIADKKLGEIKGIGKGLQSVIYEFSENGNSSLYDELKKEFPEGVDDLFKIKGMGPKKVQLLFSDLGISNITQLEEAVKQNKLNGLKGFSETLINSLQDEINKIRENKKYILLDRALEASDFIINEIKSLKSVLKIEATGDLRRGRETISLLTFIALINKGTEFLKETGSKYSAVNEEGDIIIQGMAEIPVKIFYFDEKTDYERALLVTTGSFEFVNKIFGLKVLKGESEEEIFQNAKIPYVIPEMREEEYVLVKDKKLKENSDLNLNQLKGLLHWHTTYSDGRDSLESMLGQAEKMNFTFAAVCDHSKAAAYANGLKEERVIAQKEEIEKLRSRYKLKIFQGIESDILSDGSLDYPDEFLPHFDFIVASVHSRFNLDEKEMTARIIRAIENPYTDLLGHPSGRLLLARDPYKIDTKKIIDACAANFVAIEINSHPKRLDLDWRWIYYAREKGCMFSINADAHSIEDISKLKYGIMMGRKGGLMSSEVINCYELEAFKKFLTRKVKRNFND